MEIEILQERENKVLNRTEVKFDCIYQGKATPKLLDVKSKLVALLNAKKDLLVVDSIQPHYGEAKAAGYAKIYDSKKALEDIETPHIIEKNKEAEAPVEEEETSEDAEAPSEETEDSQEE